jgi:hypothetical protein
MPKDHGTRQRRVARDPRGGGASLTVAGASVYTLLAGGFGGDSLFLDSNLTIHRARRCPDPQCFDQCQ